jgi:acyl dehydratase
MRERKEIGIDFMKLVHGEQAVRLHAPLPPAGTVVGRTRVTRVVDKGEGKGAILHVEKELADGEGRALATVESVYFLRGDGGFSAADGRHDEPAPAAPATPESAPEHVLDLPTRADQALLYRLSGDINPLHADPAFAAKAGFARPILARTGHLGHRRARAGRRVRGLRCDTRCRPCAHGSRRLSIPARPSAWKSWRDGGEIAFRARVVERDVLVLTNGRAELA